jgi:hypothetical protein
MKLKDWIMVSVASCITLLCFAALFLLFLLTSPADARWKPEYANAPQSVRDWYNSAELTKEAQKRFGFIKCCDHADVVRTQFKVDKSTGKDVWLWLNPSDHKWHVVPNDIIHGEQRAPGGKPILFIFRGHPTCFFLPESGI